MYWTLTGTLAATMLTSGTTASKWQQLLTLKRGMFRRTSILVRAICTFMWLVKSRDTHFEVVRIQSGEQKLAADVIRDIGVGLQIGQTWSASAETDSWAPPELGACWALSHPMVTQGPATQARSCSFSNRIARNTIRFESTEPHPSGLKWKWLPTNLHVFSKTTLASVRATSLACQTAHALLPFKRRSFGLANFVGQFFLRFRQFRVRSRIDFDFAADPFDSSRDGIHVTLIGP